VAGDVSTRFDADELARAEEQRAFLRRSLADLDHELAAGEIGEDDHRTLRAEYERRLAEAEGRVATRRDALPARRPRRRGPVLVGALVVLAVAVAAGIGVAASSGSRRPGDTITGETPQTTAGLVAEASDLARDGKYAEALRVFDRALERSPDDPDVLAERGLLLVQIGMAANLPSMSAEGRRSIERAAQVEPADPRNDFYLALVLELAGDDVAADAALAAARAKQPKPPLSDQIAAWEANKAVRRGSGTSTTTTP
jgi:cytochrome c-type biogenesis protein CcmH